MNAEIAVMNKEAIALAADSAVTMPGQKIFTSANKLFALSKYHPVGIMIYGSANFMGIPWETIVKIYRSNLGKKRFKKLEEYINDFINFLNNGNPLFPETEQEKYLHNSIYAYFKFIKKNIENKIKANFDEKGKIYNKEINQIIKEIIKANYDIWYKADNIPSIPKSFNKNILDKYEKFIEKAIIEVFEKLPLSKNQKNQLKIISSCLFSKFPKGIEKENISGIVIAGFGEDNNFPSLKSFHLDMIVENKLKYIEHIFYEINYETSAAIIPFAHRDMVATFMEGIDPSYRRDIEEKFIPKIFSDYTNVIVDFFTKYNRSGKNQLKLILTKINKKILNDFIQILDKRIKKTFVSPITSVVSMLPKDELAAMAESLVTLTSFKLKVTMEEEETVGGPIDVAIISKGDGLIWIKRKHYFKAELNQQFFANYYR